MHTRASKLKAQATTNLPIMEDSAESLAGKKARFNEKLFFEPSSLTNEALNLQSGTDGVSTPTKSKQGDDSNLQLQASPTPKSILKRSQANAVLNLRSNLFESGRPVESLPEHKSVETLSKMAKQSHNLKLKSIFPNIQPRDPSPSPSKLTQSPTVESSGISGSVRERDTSALLSRAKKGNNTSIQNNSKLEEISDSNQGDPFSSSDKPSSVGLNIQSPFNRKLPPNKITVSPEYKLLILDSISVLKSIYASTIDLTSYSNLDSLFITASASLDYIQSFGNPLEEDENEVNTNSAGEDGLISLKIQIYGAIYLLLTHRSPEVTIDCLINYSESFLLHSYKDLLISSKELEKFNSNLELNGVQARGRASKRIWTSPKKKNSSKQQSNNVLDTTSNVQDVISSDDTTRSTWNSKLVLLVIKSASFIFSQASTLKPQNSKKKKQSASSKSIDMEQKQSELQAKHDKLRTSLLPIASKIYSFAIDQLSEQDLPRVS